MKWTPEQDQRAIHLRQEGWSAGQIADQFGRTRSSVLGRFRRLGLSQKVGRQFRWRPIETAPRDATPIIGMCIKHYPGGEPYCEAASMMYEGGDGQILKGAWAYTGVVVSFVKDEFAPSHWMHMPPPIGSVKDTATGEPGER